MNVRIGLYCIGIVFKVMWIVRSRNRGGVRAGWPSKYVVGFGVEECHWRRPVLFFVGIALRP